MGGKAKNQDPLSALSSARLCIHFLALLQMVPRKMVLHGVIIDCAPISSPRILQIASTSIPRHTSTLSFLGQSCYRMFVTTTTSPFRASGESLYRLSSRGTANTQTSWFVLFSANVHICVRFHTLTSGKDFTRYRPGNPCRRNRMRKAHSTSTLEHKVVF